MSILVAIAFLEADAGALDRHIVDLATGVPLYGALALYDQAELKGDLTAARHVWEELPEAIEIDSVFAPIRGVYHGLRARIALAAGQAEEATEAVATWKKALDESPPGVFETAAVSALDEETIALLDTGAAQTANDALQSHDARVSILGRSLDPIRGFLALGLGRLDEAERHFHRGLSVAEQKSWTLETARSMRGLSRIAAKRGQA